MNEHPLMLTYRSLFTIFLTCAGYQLFPISVPNIILLFAADTIVHCHPCLFRQDLFIHHLAVMTIFTGVYMNYGDERIILYALQSEIYSALNFLRHMTPKFYHYWRIGTIIFVRLPLWVWLYQQSVFSSDIICRNIGMGFWLTYDMRLLRLLLTKK